MENVKSILSNNKELDIYVPSKSVAIECDGLFWHGEDVGNKGRRYHIDKTIECESKGIRLIHIFEDEWTSKKELIKIKLAHLLKLNSAKSIFARKGTVSDISKETKALFLDANHIQGNCQSSINLGLLYNGAVVAVMTFGHKRIFMNSKKTEGEYELLRYATDSNYTVIGGASKLMSYFITHYHPSRIISYADRRWTYYKNNLYERIGFKKVSDGTPNYWYFGRQGNYRRFHRFGFAKHTLSKRLHIFDPSISEWENMKNNGWDRIWDCGNLKYEMAV
jgi:hypothetical protein